MLPEAAPRMQPWENVLEISLMYFWDYLNCMSQKNWDLVSGTENSLIFYLLKTKPCKFPHLFKLLPANLEWLASFSGLSQLPAWREGLTYTWDALEATQVGCGSCINCHITAFTTPCCGLSRSHHSWIPVAAVMGQEWSSQNRWIEQTS